MVRMRISAAVLAVLAVVLPSNAIAQQSIKDQIVGAWTMVSVVAERADGSKGEPFGSNPRV